MPALDFDDFTTQLILAAILGAILLLVHRSWVRNVKRSPGLWDGPDHHDSSVTRALDVEDLGAHADGAEVVPGDGHGGARPIIAHNIEASPDALASDDDYGKVVLVLLFMGVGAVLFLLARPMVEALSYGILASTALMALVAANRTQTLGLWSGRAIPAAITVVGAGVVAVLTWHAVEDLRRGGFSVKSIGDIAPAFSGDPDKSTLVNYFDYVVDVALPALFNLEEGLVPFVACLVLAAMAAVALCAFALSAVWDWNAYLSFSRGTRTKKNVVARARSHQQGGPLGLLLWAAAFGAVALTSAHGKPYDMFVGLTSG